MNGLIRNVIFVFSAGTMSQIVAQCLFLWHNVLAGGTIVLAGGTVKVSTGLEDLLWEMQGCSKQEKQVSAGGSLEAEDGPISLKPFAKLQLDGQDIPIFYLFGNLGYVLVEFLVCKEKLPTQEGSLPSTQILQRGKENLSNI